MCWRAWSDWTSPDRTNLIQGTIRDHSNNKPQISSCFPSSQQLDAWYLCVAWNPHLRAPIAAASYESRLGNSMFRLLSTCYSGRHLASRLCLAVFHRGSVTSGGLERLQRLCLRLEQLQRRVKCPRPEGFTVGNETFQIPVRTVSPPAEPPQRQELEYLVGFFDGDGSVSLNRSDGQVSLQIDQNIDSAQVLLRYQRALGGGIWRARAPTGRNKACLKWQVLSANARQVASWLASITSMKQAQLEVAAVGPVPIPVPERHLVARGLRQIRQSMMAPAAVDLSWSYFAGFFDADGTITLGTSTHSLTLRLTQVNCFGLSQVVIFLHQQGHTCWRLRHTENCAVLSCSKLSASKRSLELMLKNGLLVKKEQAELALTLTAANHKQVREAMSKLKGNQSRYRRLDEAGIDRAKQIKLRGQELRKVSLQDREQREEELQALRQEHIRLNLICKANTIRGDIRRHLREGAAILPYSAAGWAKKWFVWSKSGFGQV